MGYLCLSNGIGIIRHWVAPKRKSDRKTNPVSLPQSYFLKFIN